MADRRVPPITELHARVDERLSARDQRYTDSRRRIVEALSGAGHPMTLPELLGAVPGLAQSSAYRNLGLLEEAGVVRRLVHGSDHAHYELAEDLTEHHHHLICTHCGVVRDITLAPRIERSLDSAVDGLAAAQGFTATHHAIDIYGRCAACAAPGRRR